MVWRPHPMTSPTLSSSQSHHSSASLARAVLMCMHSTSDIVAGCRHRPWAAPLHKQRRNHSFVLGRHMASVGAPHRPSPRSLEMMRVPAVVVGPHKAHRDTRAVHGACRDANPSAGESGGLGGRAVSRVPQRRHQPSAGADDNVQHYTSCGLGFVMCDAAAHVLVRQEARRRY